MYVNHEYDNNRFKTSEKVFSKIKVIIKITPKFRVENVSPLCTSPG